MHSRYEEKRGLPLHTWRSAIMVRPPGGESESPNVVDAAGGASSPPHRRLDSVRRSALTCPTGRKSLNAPLLGIDFETAACVAQKQRLIVRGQRKPCAVGRHKLNFIEVDNLARSVFAKRNVKNAEIITSIIGEIDRLSISRPVGQIRIAPGYPV
jgi:hypothetical protein